MLRFFEGSLALAPPLDSVLALFWRLRRSTPGDQPIALTWRDWEERDPYLLELLQAGDEAYLSEQSKLLKAKTEAAKGIKKH